MSQAELGYSNNDFISQTFSVSRQPRAAVSINGIDVPWESWEIDSNSFYLADTFKVTIPTSSLPKTLPISYFSSTPAILVEIKAGFPPLTDVYSTFSMDTMIVGQVDDVFYEPTKTRITLSGRDLTAKFIDNKTTEKFQNLYSSDIAIILAERRGLEPIVTSTKQNGRAGKYYEIDHVRLTDQKSEWDLLTYLAHAENYSVFVKGYNLYFQPKTPTTSVPYLIDVTKNYNVVDISFSRNLTLAKDVIVKVRSWNIKEKKAFTVKVQSTHTKNTVLAGAAQPIGEAQVYSYTFPNLTKEQALQKAQSLLNDITQHEMKVDVIMPADNLLQPEDLLKVIGTNSNYDQTYYVASIVRSMSFEGGYSMHIEAKNHSPDSYKII